MKKYCVISMGVCLLVLFACIIAVAIIGDGKVYYWPNIIRWAVVILLANGIIAWIITSIFYIPFSKKNK